MNDLTEGNVVKLIVRFSIPILIGNIFQQLYQVIDSIIVGHFLGKHALAAIGASFPIIFMLVSFVIGIAMAGTVMVSQYYGSKNFIGIRRTIDTINIFLVVMAIFLSGLAIMFSEKIFQIMQLPNELIPQAKAFFNIYMLGTIFIFGFNGTTAILRGLGDSKTPLFFLLLSTILNTILDIVFIVYFQWNIQAVAFATVCSQFIALLCLIVYLNKKHRIIKFKPTKLVFDRSIFLRSLYIGFPLGLQQVLVAFGMVILMVIINAYGTDVIAAYSVAWRIDSFASMPGINLAIALSAFVGQNIGANRPERIKEGLFATLKITAIISIVISLIVVFAGKWLMNVFTADEKVINIGHQYLQIVGSFYIVFNFMFIIGSVMRGAGDTFVPMLITLISLWMVRIPLAKFLSHHFGEIGIWWSIPIAWLLGMFLSFLYYKIGKWKKVKAIPEKQKTDIVF